MIPHLTRAKVIVITEKQMMEYEGILSKNRQVSSPFGAFMNEKNKRGICMDENIENKPKMKMPIMAMLLIAALAIGIFVPEVNATLKNFLGNILFAVLGVQAPIQNLWEPANFTGIVNATILGNIISGSTIAGNPVSLTGTLDNNGVNLNKNVVFNFSAVGNNLGVADIPTTGFKLDGISQLMPCASVGSDYICTITGLSILSGQHTFSLDYTLDPLYDTAFPPTTSMKLQ